MTALLIVLILAVAVLAAMVLATRKALRRERRGIESRERAVSDERRRAIALTQEQAARRRAEEELHEARLRIAALEQRRDLVEAEAGEAHRRSLFRRSSFEVDPEDAERERSGVSRRG